MVSNSTNIKGKDLEKYIMMAKMHNLTSLPTNLQKWLHVNEHTWALLYCIQVFDQRKIYLDVNPTTYTNDLSYLHDGADEHGIIDLNSIEKGVFVEQTYLFFNYVLYAAFSRNT